jgi:hypothetical protein
MVGKLNRLPVETQKALQEFACLGNSAEISTLSIVDLAHDDVAKRPHRRYSKAVKGRGDSHAKTNAIAKSPRHRDGRPRWLRILTITGGSSMAAMIFKAPPQFGVNQHDGGF